MVHPLKEARYEVDQHRYVETSEERALDAARKKVDNALSALEVALSGSKAVNLATALKELASAARFEAKAARRLYEEYECDRDTCRPYGVEEVAARALAGATYLIIAVKQQA